MAHLPEDDLPSRFDVIVDGTGLVQSILAAALARAGKSVLHLDRLSYYGEQWASLMHRELLQWITDLKEDESSSNSQENVDSAPPINEDWITVKDVQPSITNVTQLVPEWPSVVSGGQCLASPEDVGSQSEQVQSSNEERLDGDEASQVTGFEGRGSGVAALQRESGHSEQVESVLGQDTASQPAQLTWDSLDNLKRRFTYDIHAKVLYCRGSLVDLLTQSNCGRYVEFKAVGKIFTQVNGELELVPCSRADMFSTKSLSMIDKRKMTRFLTFCAEYENHPEQYQEFENLPFVEFLTKHDLQANLRQYVIHCIAMVEETTPTIEALKATRLFLTSLGRFGNAPFLYPIFGVGELAQAFCRLCAVFGGVYCLRRQIQTFVVSSESHMIEAVICSTGQRISCSAAVCSAQQLATTFPLTHVLNACRVSRAIYIADGPIRNTQGSLAVISLPPSTLGTDQTFSIRMLQLDPSTNTAVPGTYMIHVMCQSVGSSAEVDLQQVSSAFFSTPDVHNGDKPRLLYALYFNATLSNFSHQSASVDGLPENLLLTSDPSPSMTFEGAVNEAKELFSRVCPGEEFLPPPPDPEDIVYDNVDPSPTEDVATTQDTVSTPEQAEGESGDPEREGESGDTERGESGHPEGEGESGDTEREGESGNPERGELAGET